MIRIFHVSDLHFDCEGDSDTKAKKLLATIWARHFQREIYPGVQGGKGTKSYLLVTGDVVDDARENQYQAAAEALSPFRGRLLMCPGNHDFGLLGNFFEPASLGLWRRYFQPLCVAEGDQTQKAAVGALLEEGESRIVTIGLNSNLLTESPLDFAQGEIGEPQLESLRVLLNRAAFMDVPTLVYLHHRPLAFDWPTSRVMALRDAAEFLGVVEGVVDFVAYGHSGRGLERRKPPGNVSTLLDDTKLLDANCSVEDGTYFQITVDGVEPYVITLHL
jgi:3',5'-cyclic AMP phosphodiesterase CpdA